MGFSTSGATAILFVGLLIAVGIAFPALEEAHDRRLTAMDARDDRALDVRNTAIDLESTTYADGALTVAVRNEGSTTLSVSKTDLLVDGTYASVEAATIGDRTDPELWQPGELLELTVAVDDPGRAKVIAENGVADTETGVGDGQ